MADLGVLGRIGEETKARVARWKSERSAASLNSEPLYARRPRPLSDALNAGDPRFVAEVKFSSPSEGVLRSGASPSEAARIASSYWDAGAAAISVLTERDHFGGEPSFLAAARAARPDAVLLMKDFLIDPYQCSLARSCGADAVLLIAALLGPRLPEMLAAARELGLSALVEAHDEAEVEASLAAGAEVVGVNSRDLRTLKIDLAVARRLAPLATRAKAAVAESGLKTRSDVDGLAALGYRGFLVGTSFMKTPDPAAALKSLMRG